MDALTLDHIRGSAPSVFATHAHESRGDRYRFFPTADIVTGLHRQGFVAVRAQQSRTRIPGKHNFTRHMLRFRHINDLDADYDTEVPEIVLLNSHDGSSAYNISLGLFRVRCTNGLVVKSAGIEDIRVRHSGRATLVDEVIDASFTIIEAAPTVLEQVQEWKALTLTPPEQVALATAALELRDTTLTIPAQNILAPRRAADQSTDLYHTFNVVQENLVKGGATGRTAKQQRRRLRGITSVDGDVKLNRALWVLTEQMAALKA